MIHIAKCFRGELLAHLHPHALTPDVYIHAPLIGRDEVSNEGMMLTNISLLELLGLVSKRTDGSGQFDLGTNALNRHIFLYGDALSVNLHSSLYDKTLRQLSRLGNKDYVTSLLDAHRRLFVQKGQFHQLMHHLGAIYKQYYGCFRTTIPLSDHEVEFATRMFGRDEGCLGYTENIADEEVDDNMSVFSRGTHDESIYVRECDEGVNHNSLDDLNLVADEDITDEERNELLSAHLDRL
jgi:hypothetical protein